MQIVITVLSIAPGEFYDALAINAASASTQISGLPFYGPVAGIRLALIGDQWVAFPTFAQLSEAVFDLTVAGRLVTDKNGNEDVAIMMVEAEATEGSWELIRSGATKPDEAVVAQGLEASKPFLTPLIKAQQSLAAQSAKAIQEFPLFPPYTRRGLQRRRRARLRRAQGRLPDRRQDRAPERGRRPQGARQDRDQRQGRGRRAERRRAAHGERRLQVGQQEDHAHPRPHRGHPHRRPRPDRHPCARRRGAGHPARARLGDLPARRDPDPGCHHAEHAQDGAADRLAEPRHQEALPAPLQLPALLDR